MSSRIVSALMASMLTTVSGFAGDAHTLKRGGSVAVYYSCTLGSSLPNTHFRFAGVGLEFQDRWSANHSGLSGFAVDLRKDGLDTTESGYALTVRVFRELRPARRLHVSVGAGAEWLIPYASTAASSFSYDENGEVASWRRGFIRRNIWTPMSHHDSGNLGLVLDARAERRIGKIPLFIALRIRPTMFGNDAFSAQTGVIRTSDQRSLVFTFLAGARF